MPVVYGQCEVAFSGQAAGTVLVISKDVVAGAVGVSFTEIDCSRLVVMTFLTVVVDVAVSEMDTVGGVVWKVSELVLRSVDVMLWWDAVGVASVCVGEIVNTVMLRDAVAVAETLPVFVSVMVAL